MPGPGGAAMGGPSGSARPVSRSGAISRAASVMSRSGSAAWAKTAMLALDISDDSGGGASESPPTSDGEENQNNDLDSTPVKRNGSIGTVPVQEFHESYKKEVLEEVEAFGAYLGLNIPADREYYWIAVEAMTAELPENWGEHMTDDGQVYYFNSKTQETQWEHPLDDYHRQLIAQVKAAKAAGDVHANAKARAKAQRQRGNLAGGGGEKEAEEKAERKRKKKERRRAREEERKREEEEKRREEEERKRQQDEEKRKHAAKKAAKKKELKSKLQSLKNWDESSGDEGHAPRSGGSLPRAKGSPAPQHSAGSKKSHKSSSRSPVSPRAANSPQARGSSKAGSAEGTPTEGGGKQSPRGKAVTSLPKNFAESAAAAAVGGGYAHRAHQEYPTGAKSARATGVAHISDDEDEERAGSGDGELQHASSTRRLSEEWREKEERKLSEFQALLKGKGGPSGTPRPFQDKHSSSNPSMSVQLKPIKM